MIRFWKSFLLAQTLAFCALALWSMIYASRSLVPAVAGHPGVTTGARTTQNFRTILTLAPDSPLASGGARPGDQLAFDREGDRIRSMSQAEQIGVTWKSTATGQTRHMVLQALPLPKQALQIRQAEFFVQWGLAWFALAAGLLVGLRRPESRSMRALSQALLILTGWFSQFYLPAGTAQAVTEFLHPVFAALTFLCFYYFSLTYPDDRPISTRRWASRLFYIFLASELSIQTYGVFLQLQWVDVVAWFPHSAIRDTLSISLCAVAIRALWCSWRGSTGLQRVRLAWVGISMGAAYASYLFGSLADLVGWHPAWREAARDSIAFIAHVFLLYGILRHRVLDFGFFINRALVYTIISSALIVVFGLAEFVVDKILHFSSRSQNIFIDAAVALGVILCFNRFHHFVNHRVDHTFFHRWHQASERLRHFILTAAYYTDPEVLQPRFLAAVNDFVRPTGGAVFLGQDDGSFRLAHAANHDVTPRLQPDHELLVELRLRKDVLRLGECRLGQYGELAFPMQVRDHITGFLVVGPKRNGRRYRPDQIEELRNSVHRIGLHLESLRVHALEQENASMKQLHASTMMECLRLQLENAKLRLPAGVPES